MLQIYDYSYQLISKIDARGNHVFVLMYFCLDREFHILTNRALVFSDSGQLLHKIRKIGNGEYASSLLSG